MDTVSLEWTIAFALWRKQKLLPGRRRGRAVDGAPSWPPGHDEFASIADEIVKAIELSGWEVRRKPPRPL
jgi:hypothetical protein